MEEESNLTIKEALERLKIHLDMMDKEWTESCVHQRDMFDMFANSFEKTLMVIMGGDVIAAISVTLMMLKNVVEKVKVPDDE